MSIILKSVRVINTLNVMYHKNIFLTGCSSFSYPCLGWVEIDLNVASSCLVAQPLLPISYQPKENDIIKINVTQVKSRWDTHYFEPFMWVNNINIDATLDAGSVAFHRPLALPSHRWFIQSEKRVTMPCMRPTS